MNGLFTDMYWAAYGEKKNHLYFSWRFLTRDEQATEILRYFQTISGVKTALLIIGVYSWVVFFFISRINSRRPGAFSGLWMLCFHCFFLIFHSSSLSRIKLNHILLYKGGLQIPIPIYLLFLTVKESLKSGSGLANGARLDTNNIGELMP